MGNKNTYVAAIGLCPPGQARDKQYERVVPGVWDKSEDRLQMAGPVRGGRGLFWQGRQRRPCYLGLRGLKLIKNC